MKLLNNAFRVSSVEANPEVIALLADLKRIIQKRLDNLKEIEIGRLVPKKTKGRPRR